jgi:hypothetical protein
MAGQSRPLIAVLAACGIAVSAAGCSADLALFRADSTWWGSSTTSASEPLTRAAPPEALMGPGGSCPPPSEEARRTVGVGMTECEVVNALGPTEAIDIGANERGQRSVVLTYQSGAHAGIYRFTSGLLASIEQLPEAPKAQKPQRQQRRQAPKPKPS